MATIRPLICDGVTSAIYNGDNIDAIPTPIPAINLAKINIVRLLAAAIPNDEIANMKAAVNKPYRLPYFSATLPATRQPIIAPNARQPGSWKCS